MLRDSLGAQSGVGVGFWGSWYLPQGSWEGGQRQGKGRGPAPGSQEPGGSLSSGPLSCPAVGRKTRRSRSHPGRGEKQDHQGPRGACPSLAPPLPPRPAPPPAFPSAAARFRFQSLARELRTRRLRVQSAGRALSDPLPMAPAALWAALAVGLQLWAAGQAVPAQVGDSPAR